MAQNYNRFNLTKKELEVLPLLVAGKSNPQIEEVMGITRNTVKKHISSIMGKLSANNRIDAVVIAIEKKIVIR